MVCKQVTGTLKVEVLETEVTGEQGVSEGHCSERGSETCGAEAGRCCVPDSTQGTQGSATQYHLPGQTRAPSESSEPKAHFLQTSRSAARPTCFCYLLINVLQALFGPWVLTAHPRVCRQTAHTVLSKTRQPDPSLQLGSPSGREDGANRDLPLRSHLAITASPSLNHSAGNAMHFQKLKWQFCYEGWSFGG